MSNEFLSFDRLRETLSERSYDRPPALVCNAHITGLAVARSLAARGVPVIALDREPDGVATRSSTVDLAGEVTYPLDDEAGFRADLEAVADALDHEPVVFPCMDEWVLAVARSDPEGVRVPFADFETVDGVLDKSALYGLASDLGVPTPETYRLSETDPEAAAEELGFPLVVKPALKRRFEEAFGTNLVVAEAPEEYHEIVESATDAGLRLLAQEFVPTGRGDLYTLASYVPERGTQGARTFVGNRLAVHPPSVGTSCLVAAADRPRVEEHGLAVLDAAGYHGINEAEFLYDERRDEFLLLDVNTRPWKWIGLPVEAGADLPAAAYADTVDDAGAPEFGTTDAGAEAGTGGDETWVYLRDYLALLVDHGVPDLLASEDWTALVSGTFEERPGLTTGVYSPADPGPTLQLLETEFADRNYYCSC